MTPSGCCPACSILATKSCWRGVRPVSARCDMPMMAFMGVRISWLMLAGGGLERGGLLGQFPGATRRSCSMRWRSLMSTKYR